MSVSIDIELDEIWDQITDKEFRAEMKGRNLEHEKTEMAGYQQAVLTAIAQIKRGDSADAITTLEREFWPKWASVQDSEFALRMAVGRAGNDNAVAPATATTTEVAPGAVA